MNVIFFFEKNISEVIHILRTTNLHEISLVHLATFIRFQCVFFYSKFQFYSNSLLVMNSFFVISHLKIEILM